MDIVESPLPQLLHNRIHHHRSSCPNPGNSSPYNNLFITQLSPQMPQLEILVSLLILSLTTCSTSRAHALCTFVTFAASSTCATSKLLPPLLHPLSTQRSTNAIPFSSTLNAHACTTNVCNLSKN